MEIDKIITIFSLVIASLAWVSKLVWSKEYQVAKDEIIKSKDAQIAFLKEQNPVQMKQYHDAVVSELTAYIDKLKMENLRRIEELDELRIKLSQSLKSEEAMEKMAKMLLLTIDDEYLKAQRLQSTLFDPQGVSAVEIIISRVDQKFFKFN